MNKHDYETHWSGSSLLFTARSGELIGLTEDEVREVYEAARKRNEEEAWRLGRDDE